jgi:sensor domain CHASE-containing protein
MLQLLNTKLLIAILAALVVIAGVVIYQRRDAEKQKQADTEFRQRVETIRKKHTSAAGNEGQTWKTYIP